MAKIGLALEKLYRLEFSEPSNALHVNPGEHGLTFMGVYEAANPYWAGWTVVRKMLEKYDGNIKRASEALYESSVMRGLVDEFYYNAYWSRAKLDRVDSQKIAEEIFVFGVNAGMRNAIRKAQKLVGVPADGIVGPMTLEAWNSYDEDEFDYKFDEVEKQYYADLIEQKPSFKIFERGWMNRAEAV